MKIDRYYITSTESIESKILYGVNTTEDKHIELAHLRKPEGMSEDSWWNIANSIHLAMSVEFDVET